jgi:hypothetical protein
VTLVRRTIPFALSLAFLCATTGSIRAQDTTQVKDTTQVRPDAAGRAGVPPKPPARVPIAEPEVPRGPLAPGSRHTFTRDSLAWTNAETLSDLLGAIPGVYLARGGFIGQSEYVIYGGRGAATLEVYWDGMPMAPVGGDSVYHDAARIYLTALRRVDVEVLPATLRVYLVSERHETLEDRSVIRVMSGDYASAQYAGLFQKRWKSGLGLGLSGNFTGSNGFSGANRSDHVFDVGARLEWLPSPRAGAIYQIRRQNQDRDAVTVAGDTGAPFRKGVRTDAQFRVFASSQPHGAGLAGELLLGSSGWGHDSLLGEQGVHQVATTLRYTNPRAAFELAGRLADVRVTRTLGARAALAPVPWVVLSGDAGTDHLTGNRSGRRAHGVIALFRGPFSLVGEMAWTDAVQGPALRQDTARRALDRSFRAGFDTRLLSGHGGLAERDAYAPLPLPDLPLIAALNPSTRSTVFLADGKIQPLKSLTLDGWYANPIRGRADFQPPTHGRAQLTFRSKFWRTFRSGAFDLKLQLAMESWSRGTAGVSRSGSPQTLNGITFYEAFVSFQIVGFTAFWDLRNAYNSRVGYVPGMPYPRNAQTFGVRWEFFN